MADEISRQAFSDLIGSIYDCALDPSRWDQTLAEVKDALAREAREHGQSLQSFLLGVLKRQADYSRNRQLLADIERVYTEIDDARCRTRLELDKLLASGEVHALMARMRRMLQRREFPRPGPGPNYPWPPV